MKKNLLLAILSILSIVANADSVEIDGISYNLNTDSHEAEVLRNDRTGYIYIPETVSYGGESYNVTSIAFEAFAGMSFTGVSIPSSISHIDRNPFMNSSFSSITVSSENPVYDSRDNCNAIIETASNTLISGCKNTTIPSTVAAIGEEAFEGCTGLNQLTIPEGVTRIGYMAFSGCYSLASAVTIPSTVTYIGNRAFEGCGSITSVSIGSGVTSIEEGTFHLCGLSSVELPDGLISIGQEAFAYCRNLSSINIPNSVTSISAYAFSCSGLTSVTLPNSLTTIEYGMFSDCNSLASVSILDGVTLIMPHAFYNCNSLISVNIPSSVNNIRESAFQGCTSMTSLNIPNSVTKIGYGAFSGCTSLASIVVDNDNPAYDSRENSNAIINTSTNTLVCGCKNTIIPVGITSIGNFAFANLTDLFSISIPNSVTTVGSDAFVRCTDLTSVTIPNSVTSIGEGTFYGCSNLTTVISYMEVPVTVAIGWGGTFTGISSECVLKVPYGTREAYIAQGWTTDIFKGGIFEITSITMSPNEICTYTNDCDLDFTDISGLKVYIASGFSPSTGELLLTRVYKVPAGEGVLLKGEAGEYEVPYGETDMVYSNLLRGVTMATTIAPTDGDYTNFILADGMHGIGFYTLSQAGEIAAGKAYLQLPTSTLSVAESRGVKLRFDDEDGMTTAIDEAEIDEDGHQEYFDMQGRRVPKESLKSGLYIVRSTNGNGNGKKIFIR